MHRLAVMTQRQLCEPFGITRRLCPLRPRIAIRMQRYTVNAQADTTLLEFRGPIARANRDEVGKQRPGLGQRRKDSLNLFAEADLGWLLPAPARFHPNEANNPRLPIHVLGLQVCQIRLRRAQVPSELVEGLALRVLLALDNLGVFFSRVAALVLETHGWPLTF